MNKFTCKCNDCQAKYEVVIADKNNIYCPSCNSQNTTYLSEEEIGISGGCSGCQGCSGCS